jgi:hypothetical protein
MATVLELARRAGVSAENVLRVIHDQPVRSDVAARVGDAIDELGPPVTPTTAVELVEPADRARTQLFENLARATAELEASVPREVGSVVVEALRIEVRPVAERVATMSAVIEEAIEAWRELRSEVVSERRERLEDVELLVELVTAGWRSVDRRLGRVERMLERLEQGRNGAPATDHPRVGAP